MQVRVFFTNEGRKGARLRNVVLSVSQATERTSVRSVSPLVREVKPQRRETVAEWSGTLPSRPGRLEPRRSHRVGLQRDCAKSLEWQ